ncbi:putative glycosyltransferase family 31 protein [Ceratocystis lukuohia]|uniref:Glycosyltransferase family 31 protein n=2 Tax=Ceratocystis TaxID=5157 RepID=A0A0F8D4G0_CERFI|nr:hypothetical protein CFO_g115 [Ceratocystis platani]
MGLSADSLPAMPRTVLLMLSRRRVMVMVLLVIMLMGFTLAPNSFIPSNLAESSAAAPAHQQPQDGSHSTHEPKPQTTNIENHNGANHATSAAAASPVATENALIPQNLDQPARRLDPVCDHFPDTSNILIIMKTGATESFSRIPTQLLTVLRCIPEYFIYSDMEQTISGFHVRNALDTVLQEAMDENPDFDLYRRQQQCVIDQDTCNADQSGSHNGASDGWNLDKYKNIHIAEKVWAMRPNYDWYMTIDADTYVMWPTLMQWLKTLDPKRPQYLGNVALLGSFPFGHGGSGYLLSKAAMEEFVGKHPGVANAYDVPVKSVCCGDYMFAQSIKDKVGLDIQQMWPTINGDKPYTMAFSRSQWCHPIVTMHHMNSEEVATFWDFESSQYNTTDDVKNKPMLIKDIYTKFVAPRVKERIDIWDNMSDDILLFDKNDERTHKWQDWEISRIPKDEEMTPALRDAYHSVENCKAACDSFNDCFQWRFHNGLCSFSRSFRLGRPHHDDDRGRWVSGWNLSRIQDFIDHEGECTSIHWPAPSL